MVLFGAVAHRITLFACLILPAKTKHRLVVEAKNSVSNRYGYLRRREPVVQPAT